MRARVLRTVPGIDRTGPGVEIRFARAIQGRSKIGRYWRNEREDLDGGRDDRHHEGSARAERTAVRIAAVILFVLAFGVNLVGGCGEYAFGWVLQRLPEEKWREARERSRDVNKKSGYPVTREQIERMHDRMKHRAPGVARHGAFRLLVAALQIAGVILLLVDRWRWLVWIAVVLTFTLALTDFGILPGRLGWFAAGFGLLTAFVGGLAVRRS